MVENIHSYNYGKGVEGYTTQSLPAGKLAKVKSILSRFDPKRITTEDAKEIFKDLRKAGILPGDDLRAAIKAEGFDYKELRTLAGQSVEAKYEAKKKKEEENQPSEEGSIDVAA